jgi:hypothetical protein
MTTDFTYHWITFADKKFTATVGSYEQKDRPKVKKTDPKFDDLLDAVDYCVRNYVGRGLEISNKARAMSGLKPRNY